MRKYAYIWLFIALRILRPFFTNFSYLLSTCKALIPAVTSIINKAHSRTTAVNSLGVMDAGKINEIDQSLQSVIIA
jgi:hypothetical protein